MSLEDRVCLVVGGVRALGLTIANSLRESGAIVLVTTSQSARSTSSDQVLHLDVREPSSIGQAMDRISEQYGRLDVLVYNPGLPGPSKPIEEIEDTAWAEVFEVNITGFFRVCRASLPLLRQSVGGGRIIAISSMTGRRPLLHRTSYAATKMALTGFVRSLALEVGQDGITVNTVSPGYVEGERIRWVIAAQAEAQDITPEEVRANVLAQSPLGSLVAPESVGRTVVFLADRASRDITGTDINVTAGVWMD
jgi:NAD(P)-dependent dehydrogenase (short-subunit alcohol dehydrogenase family)